MGALRDVVLSHVFGAGRASDAFWLAWTVPSIFRRFVADEDLTGALVPAVGQAEEAEGQDGARRLANTAVLQGRHPPDAPGKVHVDLDDALFACQVLDQRQPAFLRQDARDDLLGYQSRRLSCRTGSGQFRAHPDTPPSADL